uniref:alpha/beta fold hydrolase n=1 Tax=Paractinoplanes polyasparticus TaxID=2856853 RepID=UPI001C857BC6|nr:alpha/beta hydrolase [Actinoplanes polyasparticus]
MTIVLVHGVPETSAVWDPLVDELTALGHGDVVRLSPPGFGAPLPVDFGCTAGEYRDWLVGELSRIGSPVDLVGHDWGGGHVLGAAVQRPDLLRSWAIDVIGLFEPDYVWHDLAQAWQRPGDGERQIERVFGGSPADRAQRMVRSGVSEPAAGAMAMEQGEEMGRAILALYRSAGQRMLAELSRDLPKAAARPGLAVIPTEDSFVGTVAARVRGAQRAGAVVEMLEGRGHWWMLEDPKQGALALSAFWRYVKDQPAAA